MTNDVLPYVGILQKYVTQRPDGNPPSSAPILGQDHPDRIVDSRKERAPPLGRRSHDLHAVAFSHSILPSLVAGSRAKDI